MAASRDKLLESIAEQIADYREGEVGRPTASHVDRWIKQFPDGAQDAMLAELHHVFDKTYFSRKNFDSFLRSLAKNKKFTGDDPASFWSDAHLLDIQQDGSSQREMLAMFREIIEQEYDADGEGDGPYVYIDDAIFSGTRVKCDLADWIRNHAPNEAEVRIVAAAIHTGGEYYAGKELNKVIKDTGKKIKLAWWRCITPENRKTYRYSSDVLWPTALPDHADVATYAKYLVDNNYPAVLRNPGSVGDNKFFSSDEGRMLLEQQLLIAGAYLRRVCTNMHEVLRPLGFMGLKTLGFGSVIVTFRNCPNTCPLPFWAGDPWYPLFPRSTNSAAFLKRMVAAIRQRKSSEV
jgi:hypothetical protein